MMLHDTQTRRPEPFAANDLRDPLPPDASQVTAVPRAPEGRQPSRSAARVLVVDDYLDAADSLAMLLQMEGKMVRVAYDGPGALALASDFQPEAVLLDLSLPGMDGYEVAQRLREMSGVPRPVLIAMTGWGKPDSGREEVFDHFVLKPVDMEALGELLAT